MPEPHQRLAQARLLAGYQTASEAADALGALRPTYLGHENGSRGFKGEAERYARFYKVSLEWLLTGRGEARPRSLDARVQALPPEEQQEIRSYIDYIESRAATRRTG